jgi:hypothetical protein
MEVIHTDLADKLNIFSSGPNTNQYKLTVMSHVWEMWVADYVTANHIVKAVT